VMTLDRKVGMCRPAVIRRALPIAGPRLNSAAKARGAVEAPGLAKPRPSAAHPRATTTECDIGIPSEANWIRVGGGARPLRRPSFRPGSAR